MRTAGAAARIRPLQPADLESLAGLHRRSFPEDPWDRRALAEILAMPGAGGWLALATAEGDAAGGEAGAVRETPLGFLLVRRAADEAEVLSLGVAPERRRGGVGGRLLEAGIGSLAAAGIDRLFLEVALDNEPARRLYARYGFLEVGRRPGYLAGPQGPRDALILALRLAR